MELNYAMTTIPTILLWVLGLAVFGIGALLGYFNMNIEARNKLDAAETKNQIMRAEADKKLADAERKLEETRQLRSTLPEVMVDPGILRVKKDKTIEMDGAMLTGPLTPEKKKRLIEIVTYLRPWIEGGPAVTTAPPPAMPVERPLQTPPMPAPTSTTASKVEPVSFIAPGAPKKALSPEEEFKLLSMVQQIDTVLQKRIAGSALEKSGLHLQDSPQGGLEVHVGANKYETIDDVPDESIRNIIRAAIAEWETKYVPGVS
jgi:hypothetical protein